MKIKIFLTSFLSFMVILLVSAFLIFAQMQTIKGLRLEVLEDKLFTENIKILAWSMANMDTGNPGKTQLPPSWGEILTVDNSGLTIKSSTNVKHMGMNLASIPALLDQAKPVLDAINKGKSATVRTPDYMIALTPLPDSSFLIGFKPKSWEQGLIAEQSEQIRQNTKSITTILIFYLLGGFVFAIALSVLLVFLITRPTSRIAEAFEHLSQGNFDAEVPRSGDKTLRVLSDSFFRLKTSLKMALEKLGSRET